MGASELIGLIMDQQNFSSQAPFDLQRIYRLIQEICFRKSIRKIFQSNVLYMFFIFSSDFLQIFFSHLY
jgi:hypothetical protein